MFPLGTNTFFHDHVVRMNPELSFFLLHSRFAGYAAERHVFTAVPFLAEFSDTVNIMELP